LQKVFVNARRIIEGTRIFLAILFFTIALMATAINESIRRWLSDLQLHENI
jgi:hypothetical protein